MRDFIPDIRQVRSFVAVVDSGNFTKAARKLGVTQSAVSYSIRALEQSLDTKLIERSPKRVCATQDGVVLLRHFRSALSEFELASQNIQLLKKWGQGRVRVGATRTLCRYFLPSVVDEFRKEFPRCEIHLESADTEELIGMVDDSEIDFAYGMLTSVPSWCGYEKVFEDELVLAVTPEHPWAKLDTVALDEMSTESFLIYAKTSETYKLLAAMCREENVKLNTSLSLGEMGAITEMAKRGIGVGVTAPWVIREEVRQGELVALRMEKPIRREWGMFCLEAKSYSPMEKAFIELCKDVAKNSMA